MRVLTKKALRTFALAAAALQLGGPAQAATEYGLTISATGSQNMGYVRFMSGATLNTTTCPHGVVYIDLSTDQGRAQMSIALTARAAGRPISRVDYTNNGTRCVVDLLEI